MVKGAGEWRWRVELERESEGNGGQLRGCWWRREGRAGEAANASGVARARALVESWYWSRPWVKLGGGG